MPIFLQLPLAATDSSVFGLVLTGFLFVMGILSVLALMTYLGGKFFASRDKKPASEPVKAATPTASEVIQHKAEVDGQIAAVISAAIHVALQDRRFRVRSIRRTTPGWAQEGRRQIFSSHRLR